MARKTRRDRNPKPKDDETTVTIIAPRVDRGQQIVDDPIGYIEAARARAKEQVERDMERERLAEA